jgi:hypothetical protein
MTPPAPGTPGRRVAGSAPPRNRRSQQQQYNKICPKIGALPTNHPTNRPRNQLFLIPYSHPNYFADQNQKTVADQNQKIEPSTTDNNLFLLPCTNVRIKTRKSNAPPAIHDDTSPVGMPTVGTL